jgi:UDP-2,3-diacylglucosamine hydrolase
MNLIYFISDLHLSKEIPERTERFIHFLRDLENKASLIFFVGDLFDFWFEYKYTIPKHYFSVLTQLSRLRDRNIEIHYLPGNHDFWLGNFFDNELGIQTYDNEWTGELLGKKFYLFHGDGIAKHDVGYRFLRRVLRNKINQKLFRLIHPDWGIPLARWVSGSSRQYTQKLNLNDHSDYIEFARKRFAEGFDYVIMGHRHNPIRHEENKKVYVNLGDWLYHDSYAVFDGTDIQIEYAGRQVSKT